MPAVLLLLIGTVLHPVRRRPGRNRRSLEFSSRIRPDPPGRGGRSPGADSTGRCGRPGSREALSERLTLLPDSSSFSPTGYSLSFPWSPWGWPWSSAGSPFGWHGRLSRGFSRPIQDLVGWTELIGQSEPLPPPGPADTRGVQEFIDPAESAPHHGRRPGEGTAGGHPGSEAPQLDRDGPTGRPRAQEPPGTHENGGHHGEPSGRPWIQEAGAVLLEEIDRLDEMARTFSQFGQDAGGSPIRGGPYGAPSIPGSTARGRGGCLSSFEPVRTCRSSRPITTPSSVLSGTSS